MATKNHTPARSVRVSDDLWVKAKNRAEREGTTVSRATGLLIEGYATGKISLPKVNLEF